MRNKRIVLAISGGIAAYKCPELVRLLTEAGALVRIVLTENGERFVAPLALEVVSGHKVYKGLWEETSHALPCGMPHIELAKWAELILVAPATANCLGKLACGLADDLISTVVLASTAPLAVCPAMNKQMWEHAATADNMTKLLERNVRVWGPGIGEQACGDNGPGRMLEVEEIFNRTLSFFVKPIDLTGLNIVITAGPTVEPIDPVRFISNKSSGKMGYALAQAAVECGAHVTLVSGPVARQPPVSVDIVHVNTAQEMAVAALQTASIADIFISCAAVSDYTPASPKSQKIKKNADKMSINVVKTQDILKSIAELDDGPFTVGFAAESQQLEANASKKRQDKGINLIVANDISDESIGFNRDVNQVTVISAEQSLTLPKQPKDKLAFELLKIIMKNYAQKRGH